jgi:hypothetical protein
MDKLFVTAVEAIYDAARNTRPKEMMRPVKFMRSAGKLSGDWPVTSAQSACAFGILTQSTDK